MKRRLLNLFAITSLMLVLLSSSLTAMLPAPFKAPVAHAAAKDNYVFYTPEGNITALQDAIHDRDEHDAAFAATHVFVKGGVFGDKAFQMNINTSYTGCAGTDHVTGFGGCSSGVGGIGGDDHFGGQSDDLYVYSGQYVCQPNKGYVVDGGASNPEQNFIVNFEVSLKMAGSSDLFDGDKLNKEVQLHWVGFGTVNTGGAEHWPKAQPNTARHGASVPLKDMPDSCYPPDIPADIRNSSSDDTELSNKGIINAMIPVYQQASAAVKKAWDDAFKAGGINPSNNAGGDSNSEDGVLGCDISSSPLSWVICPVIKLMVEAIGWVDNLITAQMTIPTQQIFCSGGPSGDTCSAYYAAWVSFRNIALGLLVVVSLIVIIAQAIGMEILDAYTIRKTLPRILVAAIAITLSWTVMNFLVTLSNDLGFGIRKLIEAPFDNLSNTIHLDLFGQNAFANILGGGAALTGAAVAAIPLWIGAGGLGVLLSYMATAGLAVLVAILVLLLRQIAVIMMVLISPLMIVAYILPNTQRIFRFWWESFSKALLMFPMIAAFIAVGRVFAAISMQGADPVHGFIAFIAYFAPYFMIPLTFRMAGSTMSGVGNFVQQRSQGLGQALSGYRTNQRQQRIQRARTEGLYRPGFKPRIPFTKKRVPVGNALNKVGFWTLNADEMVPYGLGTTRAGKLIDGKRGIPGFRRGGQELESEIKRAKRDQTMQAVQDLDIGYKSGRLMGGMFKGKRHDYMKALSTEHQQELNDTFGIKDPETGEVTSHRAPENWGERMRVAEIFSSAKGEDGIEAREAGNEMRATASEFEKYTKSPETNRVDGRLLGLVSAAKAGRLEMEDVADNYNRTFDGGKGDQETALRETTILQDALTPKRTSAARGHSMWYDEKGKAHSSYEDPTSAKAQTSLMRINSQEIAGSKSEDVDALRDTLIAGASDYKMEFKDGKLKYQRDTSNNLVKKDPESNEGRRVEQVRNRIKTLAAYNYGDSDVGVKLKDIWVTQLGLPASDLEFSRGGDDVEARDRATRGAPPPEADGGPPPPGGGP